MLIIHFNIFAAFTKQPICLSFGRYPHCSYRRTKKWSLVPVHSLLLGVFFPASVSVGIDYCNFDSAALLQIPRKLVILLAYVCLDRGERLDGSLSCRAESAPPYSSQTSKTGPSSCRRSGFVASWPMIGWSCYLLFAVHSQTNQSPNLPAPL